MLQEADELKRPEKALLPEILEAKDEIFLKTSWLSQAGQLTSLVSELRSNSSNSQPQCWQVNSNMGIVLQIMGDRSGRPNTRLDEDNLRAFG